MRRLHVSPWTPPPSSETFAAANDAAEHPHSSRPPSVEAASLAYGGRAPAGSEAATVAILRAPLSAPLHPGQSSTERASNSGTSLVIHRCVTGSNRRDFPQILTGKHRTTIWLCSVWGGNKLQR